MTITEGLKKLKLIKKKLESNNEDIEKYSSVLDNEIPCFETKELQTEKIKSIIQSSEDLMSEYLDIKSRIEKKNNETMVHTSRGDYTISNLILIKREVGEMKTDLYRSLNDRASTSKPRVSNTITGNQAQIVRLYDETYKNLKLSSIMEFMSEIDGILEVKNATTEL